MSKKINLWIYLIFTFSVLSFLCTYQLWGLDPDKAITQYVIENWNDTNGLPQNSVRAILQTADGYLWFGTEEGLARFDGIGFTRYDDTVTSAITNNYIISLYEDLDKNLWIGTGGGGLVRYRDGTFTHFGETEGLTHDFVYSIAGDPAGNLWIGTDRGGLWKYKDNVFTNYTKKQGLLNDIIRCLLPGKDILRIGTVQGLSLFCMNTGAFTNYTGKDIMPGIHINCLCEDSNRTLWVGTGKGLCTWENGCFLYRNIPPVNVKYKVNVIYEDREKNLWIGTADHGLIRYSKGQYSFLRKEDGLAGNTILSICEDREGNLWVGTAFGGMTRLQDSHFLVFGKPEGLSDDIVFSIFEDSRGDLWIGTNNGLDRRRKDGKLDHFSTREGLSHPTVSAICEDAQGFIWVCTDNGLNKLQSTEKKISRVGAYLLGEYVLAVCRDRAGNTWAGTLGGLYKKEAVIPGSKEDDFKLMPGLPSKVINFLYEDSHGNLWISTLRKGLTRYRDGQFSIFNTGNGLSGDSVYCIYEDSDAVLWIGTIDGLSRFGDGQWTTYTRKDGLFHQSIYQVVEDEQQYLWMSCNKGIFKVHKGALTAFAKGQRDCIQSFTYGLESGMKSRECNGGYQSAGCRASDGTIWFPTMKGAVCIHPGQSIHNPVSPPVFITAVQRDGVPLVLAQAGQALRLEYCTKRVEFYYTAPSFISPSRVKFQTKLSGYDETWSPASSRRFSSYTNLDPGRYVFQVTACNCDGIWNKNGTQIVIDVVPPYWKTWWFIASSFVVFAFLSYFIIGFSRKYITIARTWKKQRTIGNYRLIEPVGSGGMGTIYKAVNMSSKPAASQPVAIKILKEDQFQDDISRRRFKQEAAIIDQLDHPNIVRVLERGQDSDNLYIVMELLEGETLSARIHGHATGTTGYTDQTGNAKLEPKDQGLDTGEAIDIMEQVTLAIQKIHSKNIVHRDIKPENIMLTKGSGSKNYVKLLDFGLAKTGYQSRFTRTGAVVGTLNYISPEQLTRFEFYPASDIYSLGIVFYEMITGVVPFRGTDTLDIMKQIINETPIAPETYRIGLPPQIDRLIMQMIEKDRHNRPTAEQVLESLKIIRDMLHQ